MTLTLSVIGIALLVNWLMYWSKEDEAGAAFFNLVAGFLVLMVAAAQL